MFFTKNNDFVVENINEATLEEVIKRETSTLIHFTVNDRAEWLHEIAGEVKRIVFIAVVNAHSS